MHYAHGHRRRLHDVGGHGAARHLVVRVRRFAGWFEADESVPARGGRLSRVLDAEEVPLRARDTCRGLAACFCLTLCVGSLSIGRSR